CYALLCHGHDGTLAINVLPAAERVVCNNTMNLALNRAEEYRGSGRHLIVRHRGDLGTRLAGAQKALAAVSRRFSWYQEEVDALARVSLSATQVTDYFEGFYPTKVKPAGIDGAAALEAALAQAADKSAFMADLLDAHYAGTQRTADRNRKVLEALMDRFERRDVPGIEGTAWQALNAVTAHVDHDRNYRDAGTRMYGTVFGAGAEPKR